MYSPEIEDRLWVAFDCESTGFPPEARLVELAAVAYFSNGVEPMPPFHKLVRPPMTIPIEIVELTGLTDDSLADAESADSAIAEFRRWLPVAAVPVAHNLPFDLAVLEAEDASFARELGRCAIDSLDIARCLGEFTDNRLITVANTLSLPTNRLHRALDDARIVKHLILHALERGLHEAFPEIFRSNLSA